jgi:hypothetical protein
LLLLLTGSGFSLINNLYLNVVLVCKLQEIFYNVNLNSNYHLLAVIVIFLLVICLLIFVFVDVNYNLVWRLDLYWTDSHFVKYFITQKFTGCWSQIMVESKHLFQDFNELRRRMTKLFSYGLFLFGKLNDVLHVFNLLLIW